MRIIAVLFINLCALIVFAPALYSQDTEIDLVHPIDLALTDCLDIDSNQSTFGMMGCLQVAEEAWDYELNATYKELMGSLDSAGQESLRRAQRAWLAYRDAEFELNGSVHYENLDGTMYHIFAANREMEIVKQRALELRDYLDALRDFGAEEE
ncbi:MAG: DUF1311 domain-containing protein [Ignavibacteriae bacterium]|nr:DUF1311 domain-containing protein [Ignavibacteriota bacterium]MCB9215956.1 DUF1311 domain-containing protein [Ignavibacteria bacterium]